MELKDLRNYYKCGDRKIKNVFQMDAIYTCEKMLYARYDPFYIADVRDTFFELFSIILALFLLTLFCYKGQ